MFGAVRRRARLAAVTTLGRHPSCVVWIDDTRVPLFWLEIRRRRGEWCWRPLEQRGVTRGGGKPSEHGWRVWKAGAGQRGRVTCGDAGWIELLDAAAPSSFATCLDTGDVVEGADLGLVAEVHGGDVYPIGRGDEPSAALRDGQVFAVDGRAHRLSLCVDPLPTSGAELSLRAPDLELDLDQRRLRAAFTSRSAEVVVQGEFVRVLIPYLYARVHEPWPDGGWLSTEDAHRAWRVAGGSGRSGMARLAWEKGKLRTELAKCGATHVAAVFEKRRKDGKWWARLGVPARHLHIAGGD